MLLFSLLFWNSRVRRATLFTSLSPAIAESMDAARVLSFGTILLQTGASTEPAVMEVLATLQESAFLVQGNWVAKRCDCDCPLLLLLFARSIS